MPLEIFGTNISFVDINEHRALGTDDQFSCVVPTISLAYLLNQSFLERFGCVWGDTLQIF